MRIRKVLTVLLVVTLTMGMLVACGREELGLRSLSKEMTRIMNTKPTLSEGIIELELNTLPTQMMGMTDEDAQSLTGITDFFDTTHLEYVVKSDTANKKLEAVYSIVEQGTGEEIPVMSIIRNESTTYVKIDDYINILQMMIFSYGSQDDAMEASQAFNEIFGDVKYLSVTDEEIVEFYIQLMQNTLDGEALGEDDIAMFEAMVKESLDLEYVMKKQELNDRLVDDLVQKVYSKYSSDIVTQEGNKYIVTIDADNFGTTLCDFLDYSLENSQALGDAVKEFINDLTPEQYSMLVGAYAVNAMNQEMLSATIDEAMVDVNENREEYQADIDELLVTYDALVKSYIQGSMIEVTKAKEKDGSYLSSLSFKVVVNDPMTQETQFDATLSVNDTMKVIEPFKLNIPTENVITFTELINRIPKKLSVQPALQRYSIFNLEDGQIETMGYMDTITIDNYTYLPMRKVINLFGEEVDWDNINMKPYIITDRGNVYVDNVIVKNSTSYIKARELEKLGYKVQWDAFTETITITK